MRVVIGEWLMRGTRVQRFSKRLVFNLVVAIATFSVFHAVGVTAHWRIFAAPAFLSAEFWLRAVLFGLAFTLAGFGQPRRVPKAYLRG